MNQNFWNLKKTVKTAFLAALFLSFGTPVFAEPVRVAILPFDIHAASDMTFLQEGIVDMLTSRLTRQGEVEVVSEAETKAALAAVEDSDSRSRARTVGEKLGADYVLFGSLTVFGESVSIDARMADVSGQQPPLPFYAQTQGMSAVIPQINRFAADINQTVFGREPEQPAAAAPAAPAVTAAPARPAAPRTAPPAQDPRMHPEKLLQADTPGPTPVPTTTQANAAPNPAFVPAERPASAGDSGGHWKSRRFKALITGLDIADANADGLNEVVLVTNDLVSIYRLENGRLLKLDEAAKSASSTYISVDAADINGNGTPELYVTSLGPGSTLVNSFVLEHANGAYRTISDNENWFYRTAQTKHRGAVLLGQRQRQGVDSIFSAPVQEMAWQGDQLVPGRSVLAGRKANLMGLAYGDILQTGTGAVAAYNTFDRLRIYSGADNMAWEHGERSGGDMLFYNHPRDDRGVPNKQYFPLRVRLTDIDRDGQPEVMIAHHEDLAKNITKDFRLLKNGSIECLVWNDLGLVSQWQTQTLSGRISDFAVGDLDNDGRDELVVALVIKEGALIFTESISTLVAFELNAS